ncbi:hypothetical protein C8Q70DRAFT_714397 [Cubamyces menziesii]|nr:hypothetical protein C8Q70DRAFT_714397 [Cubamyces menziesii]
MNVNKRKLDAPNGPNTALQASPSTSRNTAVPPSPRGPRAGLPTPPTSLPPRPSVGVVSPRISGIPNAPRADRERDRQAPPHIKDRPTASPRAPTNQPPGTPSAPSSGSQVDEGAQRSSKRARNDGRRGGGGGAPPPGPSSNDTDAPAQGSSGDTRVENGQQTSESDASKPIPSLLSRLAAGVSNGKAPVVPSDREQSHRERGQARRNNNELERGRNASEPVVPTKRRVETPNVQASMPGPLPLRQSRQSPDPDKDPIGGYSIRGAAKAAKRSPPVDSDGASPGGPASLLQRLQPVGGAGAGQGSDDGGGRRARKRGRHA